MAFVQISERLHMDPLRYATELLIPELRYWSMRRFPYLIFYTPGSEEIDVWRVLHGKRDIPGSRQET